MTKQRPFRLPFLISCLLLFNFLLFACISDAAVMSIDYGTEWLKVGLVKPGLPLDIVLNRDSKRKTDTVLVIRGQDRTYGSDAVNLASRYPADSYFALKKVIGRLYDDQHCQEYRQQFPYNRMIKDPIRGTAAFQHDANTTYSVEELVAMQFGLAREQAEATAQEPVRDAVITVPPYFNQFERQAILDAAELAGLRVLTLINDETAVALNWAISRTFTEQPRYHIFYDMGAGSTVASLIAFSTTTVKDIGKFNKTVAQIEVKAVGYDRTLGGRELDVRLQKLLANEFDLQKKGKISQSILENPRALTRLVKEANRVKHILSANQDTMASVEGLHEDMDFKHKVTRQDLEALIPDLLDRIRGPIDTVLKATDMKISEIDSLILVGGGVRIPAVQAVLKDIVGDERIAKNVNGDEAAVLGACFRGAGMSRQFKVKEILVKDVNSFPIEVHYDTEHKDDSDVSRRLHTTLFPQYAPVDTKKVMNFKRTTNFDFDLKYGTLPDEADRKFGLENIANVKITNLTAATNKFNNLSSEKPKVRVTLQLSGSGIVSVIEAIASIEIEKEIEKPTLADKVRSFFSGSKADESAPDEPAQTESESASSSSSIPAATNNETMTNQTDTSNNNTTAEPPQKEIKVEKIALEIEYKALGVPPLSSGAKATAIARLRQMDVLDRQRRARDEARNNLEAFVYKTQDYLYDTTVEIVSTPEQREILREHLAQTSDWLYGDGETAQTAEFVKKLDELKKLKSPIDIRREEYLSRPEVLENLRSTIKLARLFIETAKANITAEPDEEPLYTDAELEKVTTLTTKTEDWMTEKEKQQDKLQPSEDPVLLVKDVKDRHKELDREIMGLLKKKRPPKPKKENITNAENTSKESTEEIKIEVDEELPAPEEIVVETKEPENEQSTERTTHSEL